MTIPTRPNNAGKAIKVAGASIVLGSASLMAFLGNWEGSGTKVYPDELAAGLPTACFGITKHTSPIPVVVGDVWSEEQCIAIASQVVAGTQMDLAKCFKVPPTQPVFDAFSSHMHNFGLGNTCASRAMGLYNEGKVAEACRSLAYRPDGSPNWSYVGNTFYRGLHNRRKAEMEMCLKGVA